jgi:hypothetical protein
MPQTDQNASRSRAEALFRRREQQKADAPVAMAEYRAAERAKYERMRELRALRLAREAQLARDEKTTTPRGAAAPVNRS